MPKKVIITVNDAGLAKLFNVMQDNPEFRIAMDIGTIKTYPNKNDIELLVNGLMTYDLWNEFCNKLKINAPFPG